MKPTRPNLTKNSTLTASLVLAAALFLAAQPVNAQNIPAIGLTAINPRVEMTVNPGRSISKEIKVRNESSVEKLVSVSVKDFIVTDDTGTPVQLDTTSSSQNRWAASSWIQISPQSSFRLKPGETKSLVVTAIAPDNALPGGHYAMVLYTPDKDAVLNGTRTSIQANVGSLIYITVPGDIKQSAKIKNFTAPGFQEYGPVDFKSTLANLSDIHITPAGSINITNMLGGKTAVLPLETTNIFPYTTRDYQNTLSRRWLFGRYKADLIAAYGTAGGVVTASVIFWVIPWKLILLISLIIAICAALIYINKNRFGKDEAKVEQLEQELEKLKNKYSDRK